MPHLRTAVKHITELSRLEAVILRSLTMGDSGSMERRFKELSAEDRGWVVIHYDLKGGIIGWALVFEDIEFYHCETEGVNAAYFFVHPDHRRQGVGSRLMRHVRTIDPQPLVVPWDDQSVEFFKSLPTLKCPAREWGHANILLEQGRTVQPV